LGLNMKMSKRKLEIHDEVWWKCQGVSGKSRDLGIICCGCLEGNGGTPKRKSTEKGKSKGLRTRQACSKPCYHHRRDLGSPVSAASHVSMWRANGLVLPSVLTLWEQTHAPAWAKACDGAHVHHSLRACMNIIH
jgi:hypothetical protein